VELALAGEFDRMVAFHPPNIASVPIAAVVGRTKFIPLDFDALRTARATGISFGD
jgi:6-phosphofructokinase 1